METTKRYQESEVVRALTQSLRNVSEAGTVREMIRRLELEAQTLKELSKRGS